MGAGGRERDGGREGGRKVERERRNPRQIIGPTLVVLRRRSYSFENRMRSKQAMTGSSLQQLIMPIRIAEHR